MKGQKMGNKKETNDRLGKAGGQALIEGIMMNGPGGAAIAVRRNDGAIIVRKKGFSRLKDKYKILAVPFIRGIVNFIESMILGYKCLMESAELSGMMDVEAEENPSKLDKWLEEHLGEKIMQIVMIIGSVLGVGLALVLFMYLPSLIVGFFNGLSKDFISTYNLTALFEGIIKIVVFILYIFLVSRMKDIKRTFMYHGAEHKTIFCYESGKDLTVENIRSFTRFHPRCGTSFIFAIMLVSIFISSGILILFEGLAENRLLWVLIKILILPLIMGIGYEFIRLAGKYDNVVTRVIAFPGLLMQRLTTVEPTDDMIEVAIEALNAVIKDEDFTEKIINAPETETPSDEADFSGDTPEDNVT